MASVEEDGYTFQTTNVTDLPKEMLTHILEKSPLKDALSFGIANRDTFNAVSRNPNFAKRACKKEFFTKPYTRYSINRICDPDNTEFESRTEKFCKDKAQDYLCSRVFANWANLIPLGPDESYAVPNGFEALIVRDYESENCPNDVKIVLIPDSVRAIYGIGPEKITDRIEKVEGMNNVEIIGMEAFLGCESLESITIPNTVTEIGHSAFEECHSLTSITIPKSVTKIYWHTFRLCLSLRSVTIPNSLTAIGRAAFSHCRSLKSVTLPNSITEIRQRTFYSCRSLESITIPDGVTKIGQEAFSNCWGLRSVTIPNSVTKIGVKAFFNCYSLEYVTIPNSITKIGKEAFSYCRLKSITIPNSVTNIGYLAFSNCYALESVTIPARYKSRTKLERIFGFLLDSISFTFT